MIEDILKPKSLVEIALLSIAFYVVLNFIKGTRGAVILKSLVFVFVVAFIGAMYVADQLGLDHIKDMLKLLLSGSSIALIVIFTPEMRRGLLRIAQSPLLSPLFRGSSTQIADAIVEALDGPDCIYLSIDVDVVDPGSAPGTGTPEPGGMLPRELLRAVRQIVSQVELVGMDVVEVSPPYDPADVTAALAHRCVLEAISALAARKG